MKLPPLFCYKNIYVLLVDYQLLAGRLAAGGKWPVGPCFIILYFSLYFPLATRPLPLAFTRSLF